MRNDIFQFEAEECRRQAATTYSGRPEGPFLLRLASAFDDLARETLQAECDKDGARED